MHLAASGNAAFVKVWIDSELKPMTGYGPHVKWMNRFVQGEVSIDGDLILYSPTWIGPPEVHLRGRDQLSESFPAAGRLPSD